MIEPSQRSVHWSVFHIVRVSLGIIFLAASYDKILYPQAFSLAVYQYQILPGSLVNLAALILPWLELLIGLCLLANIWLPGAGLLSTVLMIIFTVSLIFNHLRGLDIHCGCFSTDVSDGPADLWTIVRDIFFLAMTLYLVSVTFFKRWAAARSW
ncbi:MAG: DoxX family protein [Desulfofustis sp.]|nr:DoxX family protein [Desulfofustis sp.]